MDRENSEQNPEFNVFNILQYYFSRFVFYDLSYSEES